MIKTNSHSRANAVASRGFSLIELLVAMAIVGVLVTIAAFGIRGARETARDARRETDLQNIKTSLEFFNSDCGYYPTPTSGDAIPEPLIGEVDPATDPGTTCSTGNTYMADVPEDPQPTIKEYYYFRSPSGTSYVLCAALEDPSDSLDDPITCTGASDCGADVPCNLEIRGL